MALLNQPEGIVPTLLEKVNIPVGNLQAELTACWTVWRSCTGRVPAQHLTGVEKRDGEGT
jgi:hypothetical protein